MMLWDPAHATTRSKLFCLEVCGPTENGATARGASAVAFTNSRRLIVLMGAPPGDQTFTPSSPLPRCWFRNLSASPSLRTGSERSDGYAERFRTQRRGSGEEGGTVWSRVCARVSTRSGTVFVQVTVGGD